MGILHIPKIPQYGVVIEEKDEINNSLFCEIYNDAANNVADIIVEQKCTRNELFLNPCVAFVGKRGTGKSSAMCSFANLLEHVNTNTNTWIKDNEIREIISKSMFYVLPAIDTANMDKKETILSTVSSEMFNIYNKKSKDITIDNRRIFIESAMKVNNTAMLKTSGEWTKQGDKLLLETDNVVHLKVLFEKMVRDYLTIVENNSSENSYLVIQLDDLDMNICNSFAIMEEIRNILSVKNVIVLLSVDIEQLKTVLTINFSESLHSKYNETVGRCANKTSKDLSYKYIEKLLPINRRHYMPELSIEQLGTHLSKNFLDDEDKNWFKMQLVSREGDTPTILDAVMHLIWRKTMIIPMCNENKDYMLLPHNLRSLCNLVVFLRNMKDVAIVPSSSNKNETVQLTYFDFANDEKHRVNLEHNLRDFYKYIISNLEVYKAPEMNSEDEQLANTLITLIQTFSDVDLSELNRKILSDILYNINNINNKYYNLLNKNNTLNNIYYATAYADTVSMGDVLYLLGKIDRRTNCSYIRYLIEVIRTLWSIKMTSEIYINGCNHENANNLEPESKFITEDFRNAVGAMIINPDVSESFLHSYKSNYHDWSINMKRTKRSIYDTVISKNDDGVHFVESNDFLNYKWRVRMRTGEPIYKEHYRKNEHYLISHPMLLFSNLLYPELLYTDMEYNGEKSDEKTYTEWQNNYIMALPFYSMDYMYRLYINFRKKVKGVEPSNHESIMKNVIENMIYASEELNTELKKYIPQIPSINSNDEEHTSITNIIFVKPLKSLLSLIDWSKELIPVNKELVSILKETNEMIKKIIQYNSLCDESEQIDITPKWNSMIEYLRRLVPSRFISNYFNSLSRSDIGYPEKIEDFSNLISALDGEADIIPYFYKKEIDNNVFQEIKSEYIAKKEDISKLIQEKK